ncbi:MAG: Na+/H+ antiporter subunit E [Planctomycetota bacterium]
MMKYLLSLTLALAATWLLWSGHFKEPFLLILGVLSVALCLFVVFRMRILDNETAPLHFGLRPFLYLPYLVYEIARSNWSVAKIVLSPKMPINRNLTEVQVSQRTAIGRVVMANSITLTPGTVSIRVEGNKILVHALSFQGAAEDESGEMDRRVSAMEGRSLASKDNLSSSESGDTA